MADENYRRLNCASCSGLFEVNRRGKPRAFCHSCSPSRRPGKTIYLAKPCKQCGTHLHGTLKQLSDRVFCSQQCNATDRKQHNIKACEICGKEFHRRLGGAQRAEGTEARFCSNACRFDSQRLDEGEVARREEESGRAKAIRAMARAIRRLSRDRTPPPEHVCADCGEVHKPGPKRPRTVCAACLDSRAKARVIASRSSPIGKARRRAGRSKAKAVRRARMKINAECIDPYQVFARDKWRCQLCGVSTPRRLRGTYGDDAPELDHVIPLALGGSHTWANVQCACRSCNLLKGAKPLGQMGIEFSEAKGQ